MESAAARRVAPNLFVRNMDLGCRVRATTGVLRLWWAVCHALFNGRQLAVDTILVSVLKGNGESRRGAVDHDRVALREARRVKERTYPEFVAFVARARLVVFAVEVGGRWSEEAQIFIRLFARARVWFEPRIIQRRLEQAWRLRWYAIISCAAARAFVAFLLGLRGGRGSDG